MKLQRYGFTLIELLVVLVIIAILAAILQPMIGERPRPTYQARCMNNQRQIVLGFIMWQNDHAEKLPWQSLVVSNGTMELISEGHPSTQFKAIADYLKNPRAFLCPTDKSKSAATNYTAE